MSNLPQIIEDCRQSEACNFETAQYIDKPIMDVSSTMNAPRNGTKLGAISHGVLMQLKANKLAYFVQ